MTQRRYPKSAGMGSVWPVQSAGGERCEAVQRLDRHLPFNVVGRCNLSVPVLTGLLPATHAWGATLLRGPKPLWIAIDAGGLLSRGNC